MANKRQRKKQQAKRNVERLKKVGVSDKRTIRQLKNKPKQVERTVKTVEKKRIQRERQNERNRIARERNAELKALGYSAAERQRMRYWGQEHYEKEVGKRRRKLARKKYEATGKFITIYWRDKTEGFAPADAIEAMKHEYQTASIPYLIESIKGFLKYEEGEIGDFLNVPANSDQNMDWFYDDWHRVYHGKAARYKELLIAINAMVGVGLYKRTDKNAFMYDLIMKLNDVNPKTAARLSRDLEIRIRRI